MNLPSLLRRSAFAFPLAALVAMAMLFISETSYREAAQSIETLREVTVARLRIQQILRRLLDAETAQRGYLLTGRKDYLAPFEEAREDTFNSLRKLTEHYDRTKDGRSLALTQQLSRLVSEKLSEITTTIGLHDEGKEEAWRELILTDIGKEKMEELRTISEQLLTFELGNFNTERQHVIDTLRLNRIGVALLTAASVLALAMYLRQSRRLERSLAERQRATETERDRLDAEVRRRTADLTALARGLQTAQEDERGRLARELHDELGALLTAAKLDATRLKARWADMPAAATERLLAMNQHLNNGIALKRRIIEDLGLVAALQILIDEFSERSGLEVRTELASVAVEPSAQLTLYRLVQEALTNIAKYAHAQSVQVSLRQADGQVQVQVRDDGVGFDTEAPRLSTHGLTGMRYRVESEGGEFTLTSAPGEGTWVAATIPVTKV
jgi:signal transduction histidine kinase